MATDTRKISFNKEEGRDFSTVLRERVTLFFKERNLSPKAHFPMIAKSVFLIGISLLAYLLLLLTCTGVISLFVFNLFLGFSTSIGAMNIAHDALHGAYVSNTPVNRLLGLSMDLCGTSSFYWRKEHTIDHHTFTNIAEHDADLSVPVVLRLCPQAPRFWFHRFQHLYAPFLYCLNLIHWIYFSDVKRILNRVFLKSAPGPGRPSWLEVFLMLLFKGIHLLLFLILPLLLLPFSWWIITLAYLSLLAMGGMTLTIIFQLAHIVENVAFPLPDEEGKMENSFIQHQFQTTSNFATKNWLVNFLFGGLNFQVEHHIFPHICHMHLRKISPIVQSTAKEFGISYNENPSFFAAILSHFRTLKRLGKIGKL